MISRKEGKISRKEREKRLPPDRVQRRGGTEKGKKEKKGGEAHTLVSNQPSIRRKIHTPAADQAVLATTVKMSVVVMSTVVTTVGRWRQ